MSNTPRTYNATDFAAYHNGTMSAVDMHVLEQAALQDEFLSEALEGYGYAQKAEDDVIALQTRLKEKISSKPLLVDKKNNKAIWWRVAAAIIITAGFGYFIYNQNETVSEPTLANIEAVEKSAGDTAEATLTMENNVADESDAGEETASTRTVATRKETKSVAKTHPAIVQSRAAQQNDQAAKVMDRAPQAVPAMVKAEEAATEARRKERTAEGQKNAADLGYSLNKVKQEEVAANRMASADKENFYVNDTILSDVTTVTSSGISKKAAPTQTSSPLNTSFEFLQYNTANKVTVNDVNNEPISGIVALTYNVDKKGNAYNIVIVKSVSPKIDEDAKRLLNTYKGEKGVPGKTYFLEMRL